MEGGHKCERRGVKRSIIPQCGQGSCNVNAKRVVVWLKTNEELSVATCREVGDLAPLGMLPVVSLKRRNIVYTEVLLLVGMPLEN